MSGLLKIFFWEQKEINLVKKNVLKQDGTYICSRSTFLVQYQWSSKCSDDPLNVGNVELSIFVGWGMEGQHSGKSMYLINEKSFRVENFQKLVLPCRIIIEESNLVLCFFFLWHLWSRETIDLCPKSYASAAIVVQHLLWLYRPTREWQSQLRWMHVKMISPVATLFCFFFPSSRLLFGGKHSFLVSSLQP